MCLSYRMSPVPRQFGHLNDWVLRKFANPIAMSSCGAAPKAASIFGDPFALTLSDPDHSVGEKRMPTFGVSRENRLLVAIVHTERGPAAGIIGTRREQE